MKYQSPKVRKPNCDQPQKSKHILLPWRTVRTDAT
jgi:hypothetical protein